MEQLLAEMLRNNNQLSDRILQLEKKVGNLESKVQMIEAKPEIPTVFAPKVYFNYFVNILCH